MYFGIVKMLLWNIDFFIWAFEIIQARTSVQKSYIAMAYHIYQQGKFVLIAKEWVILVRSLKYSIDSINYFIYPIISIRSIKKLILLMSNKHYIIIEFHKKILRTLFISLRIDVREKNRDIQNNKFSKWSRNNVASVLRSTNKKKQIFEAIDQNKNRKLDQKLWQAI